MACTGVGADVAAANTTVLPEGLKGALTLIADALLQEWLQEV